MYVKQSKTVKGGKKNEKEKNCQSDTITVLLGSLFSPFFLKKIFLSFFSSFFLSVLFLFLLLSWLSWSQLLMLTEHSNPISIRFFCHKLLYFRFQFPYGSTLILIWFVYWLPIPYVWVTSSGKSFPVADRTRRNNPTAPVSDRLRRAGKLT